MYLIAVPILLDKSGCHSHLAGRCQATNGSADCNYLTKTAAAVNVTLLSAAIVLSCYHPRRHESDGVGQACWD